MKKLALILAAAIAAFSCSREMEMEIPEPVQNNDPSAWVVHFNATQTDTKAQFGELENGAYPTLWTNNDTEVKLSLNYGSATGAAVTPASDKRTASFAATFDFTGLDAPYVFYSVSPSSAAKALSPSREAWKVTIPCTQSPTATSVDEAGIILAASSDAYSEVTDISEVNLYFNHLTAYGRLSLVNLALESGETVSGVELTITTPIVGDWYWNTSGSTITDYGASSTLTINTTRTSDIWFACAPVDVSGEMMTVTVFTSLGYHEQLVEFPANRQFEAGRTAVFTVDMDGADFIATDGSGSGTPSGDFTLVTDASTLSAGDEIIIANIDGTYGLGPASTSGTPCRTAVEIAKEGDILTSLGNATILTLRAGNVDGTFAFDTGDGYLATTSTKNSLSTSSTITDAASWSISIVSGEASIVAQSGTYNNLRYNANNTRFSGYGSSTSMALPAIFKRGTGSSSAATADPLLSETEYGCYLGTGLERTLVVGEDQVTRAYSSQGILTYTIINADSVEELEISGYSKDKVKGDAVGVTVNWRQGTSTVVNQTYTMKIIKDEGPKVWLSNGSGKGVIIKK